MPMTMGRREYSEADMLRMQRDAEERVREMQARARQTVEQGNQNGADNQPPPRNRNWTSGGGMRRPANRRAQQGEQQSQQQQEQRYRKEHNQHNEQSAPEPPPREDPTPPESPKSTTIIEDIMGALGLDEDYLLIIGLLLILLNQRADTTLILALAYLLI